MSTTTAIRPHEVTGRRFRLRHLWLVPGLAVAIFANELGKGNGVGILALVAFGTGVGGFPLDEAAAIEVEEVRRHIEAGSRLDRIVFAVRGEAARGAFERALGS